MRPPFANGQYYHVYNRGVYRSPIFFDYDDYARFTVSLTNFNYTGAVINAHRATIKKPMAQEPKLVSILAWCLMPNHFHLFLQQKTENGISLFMKKLGGGFTKYINKKYDRSGHIFQSRYQITPVQNEAHYLHISRYVHLNALDLMDKKTCRAIGTHKRRLADKFLLQYRWSSYLDWLEIENFPTIIDIEAVKSIRDMNTEEYRNFLLDWT